MKVWALCAVGSGVDTLELIRREFAVRGVIGLSQREPTERISGYVYLEDYCRREGLDFVPVASYSLREIQDRERLLALQIDVLLVLGWQRLIPSWLIEHCQLCAVGIHGSAVGITRGRGHSPQNWAILMGQSRFELSIFRVSPDVDSGDVIATSEFDLDARDDIESSYHKASILAARMILDELRAERQFASQARPQVGPATYLPQRLPEDGEIDWRRPTIDIDRFVRAQTHPYPGAFSLDGRCIVRIWRARPFDLPENALDAQVGDIVAVFRAGAFVVRTGDGYLLVDDFTVDGKDAGPAPGATLTSADFRMQMRRIIDRHHAKYPDRPVATAVLRLAGLEADV